MSTATEDCSPLPMPSWKPASINAEKSCCSRIICKMYLMFSSCVSLVSVVYIYWTLLHGDWWLSLKALLLLFRLSRDKLLKVIYFIARQGNRFCYVSLLWGVPQHRIAEISKLLTAHWVCVNWSHAAEKNFWMQSWVRSTTLFLQTRSQCFWNLCCFPGQTVLHYWPNQCCYRKTVHPGLAIWELLMVTK